MPTGSDEALNDLITQYEHAINTNDARAMNDLFTEDPTFVNFGGTLVHGKEPLYRAQAFVFGPGGPLEDVSVSYTVTHTTHLAAGVAAIHTHATPPPATTQRTTTPWRRYSRS